MANSNITKKLYAFGPFRLDAQGRVLLRDDEVIQLQPKAVDMLLALIERRGDVVSKDELMKAVWQDTFVEESNLTLNISAVRKALGDSATEPKYIETISKRGYRFNALVKEITNGEERETLRNVIDVQPAQSSRRRWFIAVAIVLALLAVVGFFFWQKGRKLDVVRKEMLSPADEADVKRVVKDSQVFETLTLYTNPEAFNDTQLKQYWLTTELGGKEIVEVKASIERLRSRGRHYGMESRLERFDFTYVRIFAPGDHAEVGTIERWYLPLYENGQPVPNRNVYLGPYSVDYTLKKVGGVWLIEKTTTPRASN
jgi:DNA-binding winged helix-turn-helix (wHTH) protein